MTARKVLVCLLLAVSMPASAAGAGGLDGTDPSCSAYRDLFPQRCPCGGDEDEYFVRYGLKYCNRFMANPAFSAAGADWRDRTMACLQERLARKLDALPGPGCNCAEIRKFAFESHVDCYTQVRHSICRLPLRDVAEIVGTIDVDDLLLTAEGRAQALAVATRCGSEAPQPDSGIGWR